LSCFRQGTHRGNERSSGAGGGDISWAGDLRTHIDNALGLRESETATAETFEAEFPVVTGRTVRMTEFDREPPDRVALIDGMETGSELTAVHAGSAEDAVAEIARLANQKPRSYERRGVFAVRPIILMGHLDWPAPEVEGPALYDIWEEPAGIADPNEFSAFGFSEILLMDAGAK
jgi:hypothetical protein